MARFREPLCAAPDETRPDMPCGIRMELLGERHPLFGPNYKPGGFVFKCPRCGAVRFLEEEHVHRYAERLR